MGTNQRGTTTEQQMTQSGARRDVAHFPSSSSTTSASSSSSTYDDNNPRASAPASLSSLSTERRMRSRSGWLPSINWNRISITCIIDVRLSRRWHRSQTTIGPSELGTADNRMFIFTNFKEEKPDRYHRTGKIYMTF